MVNKFSRVAKVLFLCMVLCMSADAFAADITNNNNNNNNGNNTGLTGMDARQPLTFKKLPVTKDVDGDFLVDAFEKTLIDAYAPFFVFHPQETCWPSSVDHHLESNIQMRVYDPNDDKGYTKAEGKAKPSTWAEAVGTFNANCVLRNIAPEKLYMALPVDKTLVDPEYADKRCDSGDYRMGKDAGDKREDVYKARLMIPRYRPVYLALELFEKDNQDPFVGIAELEVFAGCDVIPEHIDSVPVTFTRGNETLSAKLDVKGIHEALDLDNDMPNGVTFDGNKLEVTVNSSRGAEKAGFVPGNRSAASMWLTGGRKLSSYFTVKVSQTSKLDVKGASSVWGVDVPVPDGGSQVYAHVYPAAHFIVVQYWLFFSYSDHERERYEGDWGDRIDIVLYRDNPDPDSTAVVEGVIPTYREGRSLTKKNIAMVVYRGTSGNMVFYRPQDNPAQFKFSQKAIVGLLKMKVPPTISWYEGGFGQTQTNPTHPVVYVAKGSHRLYPNPSQHSRSLKEVALLGTKRFIIPPEEQKANGVDLCSELYTSPGANMVCVLPQTTKNGSSYYGKAVYKDDKGNQVTLQSTNARMTAVNVGEVTFQRRNWLMRQSSAIYRGLKGWSFTVPSTADEKAAKLKAVKQALTTQLKPHITSALAEIKAAEQAQNNTGNTTTTTITKTTISGKVKDQAAKIKAKIWNQFLEAKKVVKQSHPLTLDEDLNNMFPTIIEDQLGLHQVKPLLLLARTKPMDGGEFIDYPCRWGRIVEGSGMMQKLDKTSGNFFGNVLPESAGASSILKSRWSGSTGPGGAAPQRYVVEFYKDYDAYAKKLLVFGLDIDL